MANKPMTLDPYLEILREHVTGDKKASVRAYCRKKLKRLTEDHASKKTKKSRAAGIPGKPTPA